MTYAPSEVLLEVDGRPERGASNLEEIGSTDVRMLVAHLKGKMFTVAVSRDPLNDDDEVPDFRWHVSVAARDSVPKWIEFVTIVQAVRPGVMFCVPMPPRSYWLNVNPRVLHAVETTDAHLIRQWKREATGTVPS